MYFNYPDPNLDSATAQKMYWGDSLPRLQASKAAIDPSDVFSLPQGIKPAKKAEDRSC